MRLDLILTIGDIYINCNLNPLTKFTEFGGKSMETETTTLSEFPNGRKAIVE